MTYGELSSNQNTAAGGAAPHKKKVCKLLRVYHKYGLLTFLNGRRVRYLIDQINRKSNYLMALFNREVPRARTERNPAPRRRRAAETATKLAMPCHSPRVPLREILMSVVAKVIRSMDPFRVKSKWSRIKGSSHLSSMKKRRKPQRTLTSRVKPKRLAMNPHPAMQNLRRQALGLAAIILSLLPPHPRTSSKRQSAYPPTVN
jgi:hypothetical protein